jgi:hypothetical protein
MRYPGDPTAPIELWINCRCALMPTTDSTTTGLEGVTMTATETEPVEAVDAPLAWHGVLAPEGDWSGDVRLFAPESLRFRDLPLPLTWQKATNAGHDGSVVVGKIETIERAGNLMSASGTFLATPEADEVIGLLAEFGRFGVSVDADDAEFEFNESDERITFTSARIASASIVAIPAFAEAYITLGPGAPPIARDAEKDICNPDSPDYDPEACDQQSKNEPEKDGKPFDVSPNEFVSEEKWDGSAGRFTPEQWKKSTILHVCDGMEKSCHKLPIREPGGALSRAGVHAAASRFGQVDAPAEAKAKAKSALRGAYKQLGEEPPDNIKAADEVVTLADLAPGVTEDGPGWLTHPVDTDRLRDYWVRGEGAAKIGWGTPGDFNRCRLNLAKYVKPQYLSGYCANRHYDALGVWPGEEATASTVSMSTIDYTVDVAGRERWIQAAGPSVSLVSSGGPKAPAAWFANPNLDGPTHVTVTDEGRVFGHIAEWSACHIGYDGVCVAPPNSSSDYAYYATGKVLLDDGNMASTGVISLGSGHARDGLRPRAAIAHYDSTSAAVCDVAVGEDEWGIWCAGWVRPGVTDEQVVALRASDVSGDWREVRPGQMEMVAALAVNVGGFPTVSVGVRDGVQVSLVAAGAVRSNLDDEDVVEELAARVESRLADRQSRRQRMSELASRWERRERMKALAARIEGSN